MKPDKKRIGFTTTLPVEVILAAGHIPVDLNNSFITGKAEALIQKAEHEGFPRTVCSWIKGIYGVVDTVQVDEVIGVLQGDCSNTHSLIAMFADRGIPVWDFSYPLDRQYSSLNHEISRLEAHFGVSRDQTMAMHTRLGSIRRKLYILDEMTWKEHLVSGAENHLWMVSASDFNGNPDVFETELDEFIEEAKHRTPKRPVMRLGYLGVPPIFSDLYEVIASLGAEVVYNEVQRQFAMTGGHEDIVNQYLEYTYPYSVYERIRDIQTECDKRHLDGIISYTQAFCHRQIDNILLKKYIDLPFLTLEGDQPGAVDSRTLLRIESFIEIHG